MLQELASFLKGHYTVYMPKVLSDWIEIIGHILLTILYTHTHTHIHRLPDMLLRAFMAWLLLEVWAPYFSHTVQQFKWHSIPRVILGLALQFPFKPTSLISCFPFSHTHALSPPVLHHQGLLAPPSEHTRVRLWCGPSQAAAASGLTLGSLLSAVSTLPFLQFGL